MDSSKHAIHPVHVTPVLSWPLLRVWLTVQADSETATTATWSTTLTETINVRFYHCEQGNFWNVDESRCDICADGDYDWDPEVSRC